MPEFRSLEELVNYLNKSIANAMESEVTETVKDVMVQEIVQEVYDKYHPSRYKRQYDVGGLADERNIEAKMIDDTILEVRDIREDDGRDVARIVETGEGYQWHTPIAGVPRPFHQKTAEHLEETGLHKEALKKGLERQGIKVE